MDRLRSERSMKHWSQDELASKISSTGQSVYRWENNLATPSIEILGKLADLFGCTTDYLLGRSETRK
jgi:transcriptional regulator with XRE-family HTH domain